MLSKPALLLILGLLIIVHATGQDSTGKLLSSTYITYIAGKAEQVENKLDKKTSKTLQRMQREELRLKKSLASKDSLAAAQLFADVESKYSQLTKKIQSASLTSNSSLNYNSYLDTLKTALQFLKTDPSKLTGSSATIEKNLAGTIGKVNTLGAKLDQAQAIKQFLKERRQYLKEQLSKFGLVNRMKKMNKQVYYYSQSINEYKETLKDPKKIERKALAILRQTPAFKKFMERNSQFASIFGVPSSNQGAVSFAGLQSRASVQQFIQSSVPIGGANPQQFLAQQLQTASKGASQQRANIKFPGLSDNMGEMPDFKPNSQKTKSILKRLEYGANFQFGKVNRFLPAAGELAITIGYKLNDNGTIGIGSSYKLGLGTGINHIHFTQQGFGLRSYIDWKIKGSIYISGGFEKNYLPQMNEIIAAANVTAGISGKDKLGPWQESGLIGISKKYAVSSKRKGYVQVLFDFLSYKNIPRSQPVIFRTGINF